MGWPRAYGASKMHIGTANFSVPILSNSRWSRLQFFGVWRAVFPLVQIALLTIYDMTKATDRGMVTQDVRLIEKHGGKSGSWVAADS